MKQNSGAGGAYRVGKLSATRKLRCPLDAGTRFLGIHSGSTKTCLGIRTGHTTSFVGMHRIHKRIVLG